MTALSFITTPSSSYTWTEDGPFPPVPAAPVPPTAAGAHVQMVVHLLHTIIHEMDQADGDDAQLAEQVDPLIFNAEHHLTRIRELDPTYDRGDLKQCLRRLMRCRFQR